MSAARPWLALPYGVHVDALLTEAADMSEHELSFVDIDAGSRPVVAGAYEALADDADGRFEAARAAVRYASATVGGWCSQHGQVADAVVVLCAAHRMGSHGLTRDSIARACAPLMGSVALAAVLRPALAQLGTITARGVS